jgi:hypothetical protein
MKSGSVRPRDCARANRYIGSRSLPVLAATLTVLFPLGVWHKASIGDARD